jgi:hypothetical protein
MIYGRDMKPSQSKKFDFKDKLLELFYRINKQDKWYDQRDSAINSDRNWVVKLMKEVHINKLIKLCREDMFLCNTLWRQYEIK